MKKHFLITLALILSLSLASLGGCAKPASPETVRIAGMTGPTSIGLVSLLENNENGTSANTYEFTLAGSADEITPKLIRGELDMAAIPANLASVLYNNTEGKIQVLAVNTLGVLYLVERGDSISSWADLKGRTILATGKGSTPEYTLRYLLSANGIDPDKDVTLDFRSEPAEVVSLMAQNPDSVAMLPEPYVTVARGKVADLTVALDLTAEWNKLDNGSSLITGVLVVRKDFAKGYPETVKAFLAEYEASIYYAKNNVDEAAALCEKFGIIKEAVAKTAIPNCNLTYLAGDDMRSALSGYLEILYALNPKAVGGKLPESDFYYD